MSSMIGTGNDLLNYYSDMYAQGTTSDNASKLQDTLKNKDYSRADSEELMKVCKDFEAYLVEQVIKQMKKMVPESEESSNKYLDYFGDTYNQKLAETITESSDGKGLGLAQMLYEQMKRNYGIEE